MPIKIGFKAIKIVEKSASQTESKAFNINQKNSGIESVAKIKIGNRKIKLIKSVFFMS